MVTNVHQILIFHFAPQMLSTSLSLAYHLAETLTTLHLFDIAKKKKKPLIITLKLLFRRLSMPKLSVCKLCCSASSTAAVRVRLFFATMNMMMTISSRMMVVRAAITTPTKCGSGSWSIGFGEITVELMQKRNEESVVSCKMEMKTLRRKLDLSGELMDESIPPLFASRALPLAIDCLSGGF